MKIEGDCHCFLLLFEFRVFRSAILFLVIVCNIGAGIKRSERHLHGGTNHVTV